ncbi:MAG: FAD-containing oxidoreductase, partial [Luteitalea sp.]|nr:FAD-containing oxidoreductase [Luteitalea sp.]
MSGVEGSRDAEIPGILRDNDYDRELIAHVHPSDWVNPTPRGRYNLVVIGAGTAGLVSAGAAAALGARVALIERRLMGGDCLNHGCVPSKALLRAARAAQDIESAREFGIRLPGAIDRDFSEAMNRLRRLRATIAPHDSARRFRDLGVDVYLGDARFVAGDAVEVDGQRLRFSRAVIATGARPAAPPVPGLADAGFLTNETLFELTELPDRLVIIGAGPIGCEMAQVFARFGSRVTIVSLDPRLLPREDPATAALLEQQFVREGITMRLGATLTKVPRTSQAKQVTFSCETGEDTVEADEIVVAVGRAPNVDDLDLAVAGVAFEQQGVQVDDRLRTTNRRIYAAGDVCSRYKFTHAADAMARIVIQNAFFFGRKKASALVIPWCTYT